MLAANCHDFRKTTLIDHRSYMPLISFIGPCPFRVGPFYCGGVRLISCLYFLKLYNHFHIAHVSGSLNTFCIYRFPWLNPRFLSLYMSLMRGLFKALSARVWRDTALPRSTLLSKLAHPALPARRASLLAWHRARAPLGTCRISRPRLSHGPYLPAP
jgi:hypothetical protein